MGSATSKRTSLHRKCTNYDQAKCSSTSVSGNSADSIGTCSLHLDDINEKESSSTFDTAVLNNRPETVPSIEPNSTCKYSIRSILNDEEASIRSLNSCDTVTVSDKANEFTMDDDKLKFNHVLPPIKTEAPCVPSSAPPLDVKRSCGFSTLGNAEILHMKSVQSIDLKKKSIITEQAKIIDDLNRQGLIGKGLVRGPHISMAKDRAGGMEYTLTFDTPKRQLPRILPRQSERRRNNDKPRWEIEVLLTNSRSRNKPNEPMEKSPIDPQKLKIEMLDLDLL